MDRRIVKRELDPYKALDRFLYAHDIIITDDTMCSNHFDLPVSVILVIDPHYNTQLVGFGFLPGKCTNDFEFFFAKFKEVIQENILLFIFDHSLAQLHGILNTFLSSNYVFCRKHISRNLEDNFGKGSEILSKYYEMMNERLHEEDFLIFIDAKIKYLEGEGLPDPKALKDLLNEKEHWLPSQDNRKLHRNNLTTNREEGFFGIFKRLIGSNQQTLTMVYRCIRILTERLME